MPYYEATRNVGAPREAVWTTLVALDLSDSPGAAGHVGRHEIVSGSGEGMVRRCYGTDGQSWSEVCTLYEEGTRYRFTVDPTGYPFPLKQMDASVSLFDVPGGTRIGVRFDFDWSDGMDAAEMDAMIIPAFNTLSDGVLQTWEAAAAQRAKP